MLLSGMKTPYMLRFRGFAAAWFHSRSRRRVMPFFQKSRDKDLIVAARKGDAGTVKALLTKGVDVNGEDREGRTALTVAAANGRTVVVEALLDKGADVNARGEDGMTALMLAAWRGHTRTVKVLLDNGADVNARGRSRYTALMLAAWEGHKGTVKTLLKRGADPNAKEIAAGVTAFMGAAYKGYTDIVHLLEEAGAKE
jgi:ankyrin repeat protein